MRRLACTAVLLALVFLLPPAASTAAAAPLEGRLTDAFTDTPIAGATVEVAGTNRSTRTDADGRWSFDLPRGDYTLRIHKTVDGTLHRIRVVNQRVPQYKPGRAHLYTTHFLENATRPLQRRWGRPAPRRRGPTTGDDGPVDLPGVPSAGPSGATRLTLPEMPPETIRVGRRKNPDDGCRNNPIVAIEEVDLADYARGVLPPEIGVFRSLNNVEAVYRAFARAATSYGLWFVLYYDAGRRRTVDSPRPPHGHTWFHIDDTACNQRYSDTRLPITDRAAADVAGEILVKAGSPDRLDKYEYAASCGRHGTRPEYQQALVADKPPTNACVGSWCGHDDCAGHADSPAKPGGDRCLVRGICQWGAASWAESGKDDAWLLAHYQPNLAVRRLAPAPGPDVGPGGRDTGPSADAGGPADTRGPPPDTGSPETGPADTGVPDDAIADRTDDTATAPVDTARPSADASSSDKPARGLGGLIGPSAGPPEGCQCRQGAPAAPPWAALFAIAGLLGLRRSHKKSPADP